MLGSSSGPTSKKQNVGGAGKCGDNVAERKDEVRIFLIKEICKSIDNYSERKA